MAHDRERLARFEREAQVLAALNHPPVAAIDVVENVDTPRSADSRFVGFFTADALKGVALTGAPPVTICAVGGNAAGATWNANGDILLVT